MRLLDRETGELLCKYTGHTNKDYKTDAVFSHDDAHVVCGSEDGAVCMWDLVDGGMQQRVQAHPGAVVSTLAYHPKQVWRFYVLVGFSVFVLEAHRSPTCVCSRCW